MMNTNKTTLAVMIASCFGTGLTMAQETQDAGKVLSPVVVTATRVEQDSFDLPMAIDKVEKKDIQDGQLRMTLSESLARIPGITAQNRNQMAQDPQISSRGFGARSSFGVRGLRVYVDGIPLSMPDGIGNPGSIDLDAISGIEVMRGPFSAMYGNSSGGVIQMLTDKAPATPEVSADLMGGSFDTRRASVRAAGTQSGVEYLVNYSDFQSDGFRTQSASEKRMATAKLGVKIGEDAKLTTLINWFDQNSQDPGGLLATGTSTNAPGAITRNSFYAPTSVARGAVVANTRVIRSNTQVGFNFEKIIDPSNTLNLVTYAGQRDNLQYLSTPNPPDYAPGRASQISRNFYGTELRLTNKGEVLSKPYAVTYGLNAGFMYDDRLDRAAKSGEIDYSVTTPNRSEDQKANNFDQFVQAMWSPADKWDIHAGVRRTSLTLKIKDKLLTDANGDASGSVRYTKTIPVIGAVYKATPTLNLYANVGQGFETPTLVEITYTDPNTLAGPNFSIKPSTSTNIEAGTKYMISENSALNVAVFNISTNNEIVVNQQKSTTASYTNAGKTERNGAEVSFQMQLPMNFSFYTSLTALSAEFSTQYQYTTLSSNNTPTTQTVKAGNAIPGTYKTQAYAELAWRNPAAGFVGAIEGRYNSKTWVDDKNTESAPAFTVVSLRGSFQQVLSKWRITEYARIDNLLDETYIGSVRVNDANTRYYEPAPGRNWIVGVKANYAF